MIYHWKALDKGYAMVVVVHRGGGDVIAGFLNDVISGYFSDIIDFGVCSSSQNL